MKEKEGEGRKEGRRKLRIDGRREEEKEIRRERKKIGRNDRQAGWRGKDKEYERKRENAKGRSSQRFPDNFLNHL